MKLIANDYEAHEIFKIIREWTGLTQEEIGKEMGKKGRAWAKFIENGTSRYYFNDLLEIIKKHGYQIIIQNNKDTKLKNS